MFNLACNNKQPKWSLEINEPLFNQRLKTPSNELFRGFFFKSPDKTRSASNMASQTKMFDIIGSQAAYNHER
jgi:hypothetical protein